jgi:HK97 family phage major capsid protein
MEVKELQELFKSEFDGLKTLLDTQAQEIKANGETSTKTAQAIDAAGKRIEEVDTELKSALVKVENIEKEYKDKFDKLDVDYKEKLEAIEKKLGRPDFTPPVAVKSLGEMFTDSEQYKEMMAKKSLNSSPVSIEGGFFKKELTSTITGGNLVQPLRYPEIIAPPERALRIRDLLAVRPTTETAIEYVVETGFTNNAAIAVEGSSGVKPESAITFELKQTGVKTIAHWIPVSREVLNDVSQLRAYIDTRLVYGIKLVEEAQILYGSGVAPNLYGIMPQAQSYKWSDGTIGDTKLDAIRRAMTKARLAEYPVNGVVLHPTDWEEIELLKGSDNHYIWIVVTEGGVTRLWRAPVVETTAIAVGEGLTGAFGLGAMLWDREQATIRVAEQHEDFFVKNMVVILAEERAALTVFRPEAYVNIDFDATPSGS